MWSGRECIEVYDGYVQVQLVNRYCRHQHADLPDPT